MHEQCLKFPLDEMSNDSHKCCFLHHRWIEIERVVIVEERVDEDRSEIFDDKDRPPCDLRS